MIDHVAELNRILLAVIEIMDSDNSAEAGAVIKQCEGVVIEGRMPDHTLTIQFAQELGFLSIEGEDLVLTNDGKVFIDLNSNRLYDLSNEQKALLIRTRFLDGSFRQNTMKILRVFAPAYEDVTYRWSSVDSPPIQADEWIVEHLCQLGLLLRKQESLEVSIQYVPTVAQFLEEGYGWSEERFQEYMQSKIDVGHIAEDLILKFEIERLSQAGHSLESRCVRRISRLRVNAGYDIESFNGKSTSLNYDRFIEVKGAKASDVFFFWSENEIRVAKALGKKYWIYYQGGIEPKTKTARNEPILFRNPLESIMKDPRLKKIPQGVFVEGKLKGKLVSV